MPSLEDDLKKAQEENSPSTAAAVKAAIEKGEPDALMESAAVPEYWNADGSPREGNPLLETDSDAG